MWKSLVVIISISMTSHAGADYRYPAPSINDSEVQALKYAYTGAFTPDGHDCARALTLGHPTINDLEVLRWNTVSSVELHAMMTQNGRRCECIGNRAHIAVDEMQSQYRTVENIKTLLYNVMSFMALKHHYYYPWGGNIAGFDELTQRYWVENITNYCEIPIDGLLPYGQ